MCVYQKTYELLSSTGLASFLFLEAVGGGGGEGESTVANRWVLEHSSQSPFPVLKARESESHIKFYKYKNSISDIVTMMFPYLACRELNL